MFVLDRGRTGLSGLQNLLHGSGGGIYLEVAASVTTFLLAGRLYEARARRTAGQAMRNLAAAGAKDVCVLADDGAEQRIPAGRAAGRPAVRGPPGGADRRRRRGPVRPVRRGPQHDDRGVGPGRRRRRRRRHRRHHRADRPPGGPRRQGWPGHPARSPDRDGRAGPGGQGRHPAAGRPDLRRLRPGRAGLRGPDPGRLAAGREPGSTRGQRRPGRADHRLPVRAGPGHPGRPGGRVRPRRPARHLHQGLPGAGVLPRHRHGGPGQDRHGHHRPDDGDRRAGRPRHQPRRPAPLRRLGRAGLRARRGRRHHRPGPRRIGRRWPPADGFAALPGLGARGVVDGHEVIVGRSRLFADRGLRDPRGPRRWCRAREETGCTTVLAPGTTRSAGRSR